MPHPRALVFAVVSALFAVVASAQRPVAAPTPLAPPAALRGLEAAVPELLKNGRADDAREVVAVLAELGAEPKTIARLKASIEPAAAKATKSKEPTDKLAALLRKAAAPLVAELARVPVESKPKLAALILRVDGEVAEAHAVLGHERVGGDWLDAIGRQCRARKPAIDQAILDSRALQFPITATVSTHPLFTAIGIKQVSELHLGNMTLFSEWPPAKATRMLRTSAQGSALSRWLLHEPLAYTPRACTYVHFGQRMLYLKAVAWLQQQGRIDGNEAKAVTALQAFDVGGERLVQDFTEAAAATALLYDDVYYRLPQRWLVAGHVDWIGRAAFGAAMGRYTYNDEDTHKTLGGAMLDAERDAMERLSQAGMLGARTYLRWLAERQKDPPWAVTFVDQTGKILNDGVIKDTFVHEYLVQRDVLAALAKAPVNAEGFRAAIEAALHEPWGEFEPTWRRWLLGGNVLGVADRIAGKGEPQLSTDEKAGLLHLNALRKLALTVQRYNEPAAPEVTFERELADGCRAHCRYLKLNPEQAGAWPDAHEEWPDHPGFSAAGSFAGGNSVIAGASTTPSAIDGWMGTFYHRLPLTAPGLMRTGFAIEDGIAVMDASSMARPSNSNYLMSMWPPSGATDVELHFHAEMPDPVPGEDQGKWGFPVTFQHHLADPDDPAAVVMTLHEGGAGGAVVDCWFSSPTAPTNPNMQWPDAWCLIPKAALKSRTEYTAVVEMPARDSMVWSFRTR
jgi:hypothetical protein